MQAVLPHKWSVVWQSWSSTSDSPSVQWLTDTCGSQLPRWLLTVITSIHPSHTEALVALCDQQNTAEVTVLTSEAILKKMHCSSGLESFALGGASCHAVRTDGCVTLDNLCDLSGAQFSSPLKWRYLFHSTYFPGDREDYIRHACQTQGGVPGTSAAFIKRG